VHLDLRTISNYDLKKLVLQYDYVINAHGLIKQKIENWNIGSIHDAFYLNSIVNRKIVRFLMGSETKMISVGTDCVFSGKSGFYDENSKKDAKDTYGLTKSCGEVSHSNHMILRCSVIGYAQFDKSSLLGWFSTKNSSSSISGYENHFWNGITIDVFVNIVSNFISSNNFVNGNYHLVPSGFINKYEMLKLFNFILKKNVLITPVKDKYINRVLTTIDHEKNEYFWSLSNYDDIPTIDTMVRKYLSEITDN
jgi:dTDP-4-dehydrorhamnose reductase